MKNIIFPFFAVPTFFLGATVLATPAQTLDLKGVEEVWVMNSSGDVKVVGGRKGDGNSLTLAAIPDECKVEVSRKDKALVIEETSKTSWAKNWAEGESSPCPAPLSVEMPSGLGLKAKTASGSLDISQGEFKFLELGTASGDASVHGLRAGSLRLKTASGDIQIAGTSGIREASLHSASGDIVTDTCWGATDLKSASGDVSLTLADGSLHCLINAKSASGDVNIKAAKTLKMKIKHSSASGDTHSDFEDSVDAGIVLNAASASGDVSATKI